MQFSVKELLWLTAIAACLCVVAAPGGLLVAGAVGGGCVAVFFGVMAFAAGVQRRESSDNGKAFIPPLLFGLMLMGVGVLLGGYGLGESLRVVFLGPPS